jgi:hypothetical protein
MMLRDVWDRIKRTFSPRRPPTVEQAESMASEARQSRADYLVSLRQEIRRLQQEITDTSAGAADDRLTSLYKELEQRQAELARYQGRV